MKRLLLILVPLALLITSCSKEKSLEDSVGGPGTGGPGGGGPGGGGSNTGYYIKCKIGGVDKTFDVGASATKEVVSGQTLTLVGGASTADPSTLEVFSFLITSGAALAKGTYKVDNLTGSYTMVVTYQPAGSTTAFITGTGMVFGNPFTVNITSIDATTIAGTFSGNVYEIDLTNPNPPVNPPAKSVTNGEFRVKFE